MAQRISRGTPQLKDERRDRERGALMSSKHQPRRKAAPAKKKGGKGEPTKASASTLEEGQKGH